MIFNIINFKQKKKFTFDTFILFTRYFIGLILLSAQAQADYAAKIYNPSDGFLINLSNDSLINPTPILGSDNGKTYYKVGQPIVVNGNGPGVKVTGWVYCAGKTWGNTSTDIGKENAFHRLWITTPFEGTKIEGLIGYRINSNVVMTVERKMYYWTNIPAPTCSLANPGTVEPVAYFTAQFPFTVRFYLHDVIIDDKVLIPAVVLGGYVRAFTSDGQAPPYSSWPLDEVSVPMRLAASQITVKSSCETVSSNTINLRHGQLSNINYDSRVTEEVTYNCHFAASTGVRLRLDYAKDNDAQKRLPMTNNLNANEKIYSDLKIIDESTGQSGTDIKINIKDFKTITLSSHIQGNNAREGDYNGSAWLIATYD